MNKFKREKGITLVALIITIIVLLILAVVTIRAITGDGILQYAKNSTTEYEKAQKEEKERLMQYEYTLEQASGNATGTFAEYKIQKEISEKYPGLKIGDYVNYDELKDDDGNAIAPEYITKSNLGMGTIGEQDATTKKYAVTNQTIKASENNLTWRVLGINDKGELELISATPTTDTVGIANEEGCLNAETELKTMCDELYGKGAKASGARSLKIEDIEKIREGKDTTDMNTEYGVKYQYGFNEVENDQGVKEVKYQYRKFAADGETLLTDWTDLGAVATMFGATFFRELGSDVTLSTSNAGTSNLIQNNSNYYAIGITGAEALINYNNGEGITSYWLASSCVSANSIGADWGVRCVGNGYLNTQITYNSYGKNILGRGRTSYTTSRYSKI